MREDSLIVMEAQRKESQEWREMLKIIFTCFNVSYEEVNNPKYRPMVKAIEKWAYFDRKRRNLLDNPEEYAGMFIDNSEVKD